MRRFQRGLVLPTGVPGSAFLALSATASALGVPVVAFALLLG
ncbi:hypothetical protein ACH47Z_32520 [Streptomyces sp. NPDC020192]